MKQNLTDKHTKLALYLQIYTESGGAAQVFMSQSLLPVHRISSLPILLANMSLLRGQHDNHKSVSAVRFANQSDIIFFSKNTCITKGCFIKSQHVATSMPCCQTTMSGDLQNEHAACDKHKATLVTHDKPKDTTDSTWQDSEHITTMIPKISIPFERLLIDSNRTLPLTTRMNAYAKIVRFQVSKHHTYLENNPDSDNTATFSALIDELLSQAHDMEVYPFCAYYLPLLIPPTHSNAGQNTLAVSLVKMRLLGKFINNDLAAQRFLLRGIEDTERWIINPPEKQSTSARMVCDIFNKLYLTDVLNKSAILDWYNDTAHDGHGLQDQPEYVQIYANLTYFFCRENVSTRQDFERAKKLRCLVKPFIDWLSISSDDEDE